MPLIYYRDTRLSTILLAIVMLGLIGCSSEIDVLTTPKSITVDKKGGLWVSFEGRWDALAEPGLTVIPKHNVVKVFCSRELMLCDEWVARLFGPKEALSSVDDHYMNLHNTEYNVVEWSEQKIRATNNEGVVDLELKISLVDSSAHRQSIETKARGNDTADPNISRLWILK